MTQWQPLRSFRDRAIPKINNLRRAQAAGVRVPETWWLRATEAAKLVRAASAESTRPQRLPQGDCIIRSGSPTEDTFETSNAGQLLSLVVRRGNDFTEALRRVVEALPREHEQENGAPLGCVFVQPLVEAIVAGVAFFDGFYYERTLSQGSNEALTSGQARGEVERGHLMREDDWSLWLAQVYAVFAGDGGAIDIELAQDEQGYILLQSRPALFTVARNPILSLANHKEILGDPPSPWIASVVVEAGKEALNFFAATDGALTQWDESYALPLAERAWMNFSFFFRLMDHWGLPRNWVSIGAGGEGGGPEDDRILWSRFLRKIPRLVWLQLRSYGVVLTIRKRLARLDDRIARATTLRELYDASVAAMSLAISTNFAINSVLTGAQRVRRVLRIRGEARVVTQEMMADYAAIAKRPTEEREAALDAWLAEYGHRGPLESDPARPRFAELRDKLLADLQQTTPAEDPASEQDVKHGGIGWLVRPLYWIDVRREWFRDELMRRWQVLRAKLLDVAAQLVDDGTLDHHEQLFLLRGSELDGDLTQMVSAAQERLSAARLLSLPNTASRDELVRCVEQATREQAEAAGRTVFSGIALTERVVEGRALCADDLVSLLGSEVLGPDTILVVAALEPSWAVIFPRVAGVVAEIGGELSHASILLREANKPAVVNCSGIRAAVRNGDRLRLDGKAALVEVLAAATAEP